MRVQLRTSSRERSESGAVAVMVAMLTVVFAVLLAFVTDFGMAYANKRSLQNGVDAAALAVGRDLAMAAPEGTDCAGLEALATSEATANRQSADGMVQQNAPGAGATLSSGDGGFAARCEVHGSTEIFVISTQAAQPSPAFFGAVAGAGDLQIAQDSKVIVGPAGTVIGLRPFALCELIADLRHVDPDKVITIDFSNADTLCGGAAGNFGTLDLRDPPSGSPGTLAQDWTRDGFPDPVSVADPMVFEGTPGIPSNNFGDDFAEILDEPVVIPVYDSLTREGSHSEYNITGFVAVKVCGTRLGPSHLYEGACLEANATTRNSHARWVQFQFAKYIPLGDLNLGCRLGDPCDTGLRVVKLAD